MVEHNDNLYTLFKDNLYVKKGTEQIFTRRSNGLYNGKQIWRYVYSHSLSNPAYTLHTETGLYLKRDTNALYKRHSNGVRNGAPTWRYVYNQTLDTSEVESSTASNESDYDSEFVEENAVVVKKRKQEAEECQIIPAAKRTTPVALSPVTVLTDFIAHLADNLAATEVTCPDAYWLHAGKIYAAKDDPTTAMTCLENAAEMDNVGAMETLSTYAAKNGRPVVAKKWRDKLATIQIGPVLTNPPPQLQKFLTRYVVRNPMPSDCCMMCHIPAADSAITGKLYHYSCVADYCCLVCLHTHLCIEDKDKCPECGEAFKVDYQDMFSYQPVADISVSIGDDESL